MYEGTLPSLESMLSKLGSYVKHHVASYGQPSLLVS